MTARTMRSGIWITLCVFSILTLTACGGTPNATQQAAGEGEAPRRRPAAKPSASALRMRR
ncbi:hypothetical protein LJK88_28360 [Paenibacillus sp. P26]|nr:hypothetical protein LJK88_28360 [Paenibacillus sp. P26]UUZ94758.1 hypothetical protein LJK87_09655 [Paenibacillus sp. P25]